MTVKNEHVCQAAVVKESEDRVRLHVHLISLVVCYRMSHWLVS